MRKGTKLAALTAAGVGAAIYAGFPARRGLTKAQSLVSYPGDLVYPMAQYQADRAVQVSSPRELVWQQMPYLRDEYEELLGVPLELVFEEEPDVIVWRTAHPARDSAKDEDYFVASVAVNLEPAAGGGTDIMIRERYATEGAKGIIASRVASAASWFVIPRRLRAL